MAPRDQGESRQSGLHGLGRGVVAVHHEGDATDLADILPHGGGTVGGKPLADLSLGQARKLTHGGGKGGRPDEMPAHRRDEQLPPYPVGGSEIKDHTALAGGDVHGSIIGVRIPRQRYPQNMDAFGDHGKILPEILSQLGQQGLVAVDEQGTALGQSHSDLQLGAGDVLAGAEVLQMGGADVGHHGDTGAHRLGHGRDLPPPAHAHL